MEQMQGSGRTQKAMKKVMMVAYIFVRKEDLRNQIRNNHTRSVTDDSDRSVGEKKVIFGECKPYIVAVSNTRNFQPFHSTHAVNQKQIKMMEDPI